MISQDFDIVLLTQKDYIQPKHVTPYIENILLEDRLLTVALEQKGFKVTRTYWDNQSFDWSTTRFALFRAIWDYFHRFGEFYPWLLQRSKEIHLINPYSVIQWNLDKNYLRELNHKGINIPSTLFLAQGTTASLQSLVQDSGWDRVILKPAISGGARHTYLLNKTTASHYQRIFDELITAESMLLQEFQDNISTKGELSIILFGGQYSHAVLKKTKTGDFRVQDDFGGTVHQYKASSEERAFAEQVIQTSEQNPVYARVDLIWDNQNQLCLSELEMIEPELWLRQNELAALAMANAVEKYCIEKQAGDYLK